MNKRGIFFTAIVIVIATLLILSYTFYTVIEQRQSVQKRIETMNNFLFSIEEDVPRQLYITGFRAVFLMNKYVAEEGEFIPSVKDAFEEIFYNGTLFGDNSGDIQTLMEGAKFPDLVANIQEKGDKISVEVNMTNPVVSLHHRDPFTLEIVLQTTFIMRDKSDLASWNRNWSVNSTVSVEGFLDPLYVEQGYTRKITQSPYTGNFTVATLNDHFVNGYYLNDTDAPSFIDRLEGNFTANSEFGIESFALSSSSSESAFPSKAGISVVDHEYLQNTPGDPYGCGGVDNDIYIDATRFTRYNPC